MKRLYVAITLILISLFICIFSNIKVEKSSLQMRSELESVGYIIISGNTERAIISLNQAEETWDKTESLFSFIVDADKIEEMNIGFSMIKAHLMDGNTEHALERLRECEFLLDEITANEKLNIKNIM